jgi:MFS family permease
VRRPGRLPSSSDGSIGKEEKTSNGSRSRWVRHCVRAQILLLAAVALLDYFMVYAVIFWLPTLLKRQSGIPTGVTKDAGAVPLFITAAGLLCLISLLSSTPMTVLLFSMICAFMAFLPAFWAIPTEILSESTAAVAVGMIDAVASAAGFAGPYAFGYLHTRTGSLSAGFAVLMVSDLAAAILILLTPAAHSRVSELIVSCSPARD